MKNIYADRENIDKNNFLLNNIYLFFYDQFL